MPRHSISDTLTRPEFSERAEWRASLNGKQIIVHISSDGALWHWDDGQVTLCRSGLSRDWARSHVHEDDLENILLSCPVPKEKAKESNLNDIQIRCSPKNWNND